MNSLQLANKDVFSELQKGASEKCKVYGCFIWCSHNISPQFLARRVDQIKDLEIEQKTPMRVLHRRSLLSRKKYIYRMDTEWLNPRFFLLKLETSAGTYVKEFVHGDLGRTWPNLGAILSGPEGAWKNGKQHFVVNVRHQPSDKTCLRYHSSYVKDKSKTEDENNVCSTDFGFLEADMLQLDVLEVK